MTNGTLPRQELVRRSPLLRALEFHTLANGFRSRARVRAAGAEKDRLNALADYWCAKGQEVSDERWGATATPASA